jgi:pimeloyl-ACP methyl ester carboxylesterase
VLDEMMKPPPVERNVYIDSITEFYKMTYGSGLPFDEEFHKALEGRAFDRSYCPEGAGRQSLAILSQKDRTKALGKLTMPSLIVHGDEDPLVPLAGGQATSDAIPDSVLMIVRGMGHVVPNMDAHWDRIKDAMIKHMDNAN